MFVQLPLEADILVQLYSYSNNTTARQEAEAAGVCSKFYVIVWSQSNL